MYLTYETKSNPLHYGNRLSLAAIRERERF